MRRSPPALSARTPRAARARRAACGRLQLSWGLEQVAPAASCPGRHYLSLAIHLSHGLVLSDNFVGLESTNITLAEGFRKSIGKGTGLEFECDVSLGGAGHERQEFSFTLYDFDGHGKITKDGPYSAINTSHLPYK
ncbi:Protein naked cuticle homolog [Gryllus bimaculatus]|nr:Protein naked cuticle homolog [Gryllus bimaculatus]